MIVDCVSFGTLWWVRPGSRDDDPFRYTSNAAIFNTTGFRNGARERRNWIVAGVLRFNAGTLNEQRIRPVNLEIGKFQTPGIERCGSWNRLLFMRKVKRQTQPDAMLVKIQSCTMGRVTFGSPWRTEGVRLVASSFHRGEQESLLLMTEGSEMTTTTGKWRCECSNSKMGLIHSTT
jgi:hypothetical protein